MRTQSEDLCLKLKNVNMTIKEKTVLSNVSFAASTGQILAIMGPTGSGKTTLLNIISGRYKHQNGTMTLNGATFTKRFRRRMAFVQQEDVFFSQLTLMETLMFTANLRMSARIPRAEKVGLIEKIVTELELQKCVNTVMGDSFTKGLSGGEKKRASIASELLVDPDILLLDEPTSNLDSSTALAISRCLKNYATHLNKMIVLTIHQPSSRIYQMFDRLLLLADGKVCFYGDRESVMPFFESLGQICDIHTNPADFLMEQLKSDDESLNQMILKSLSTRRVSSLKRKSVSEAANVRSISRNSENIDEVEIGLLQNGKDNVLPDIDGQDDDIDGVHDLKDRWVASWWDQFYVLSGRSTKQTVKMLLQGYWPVQALIVSIMVSLGYFQIGVTYKTSRDVFGLMFFCGSYWTFLPAMDTIAVFQAERDVLRKERASGAYRLSAYLFAHLMGVLPIVCTMPVGQFTLYFWMAGLGSAWQYFACIAVLVTHTIATFGLGLSLAALCEDSRMSITCLFSYLISSYVLGGFYNRNVPHWFRWSNYCTIFYYPFSCFSAIAIESLPDVPCNMTLPSEHFPVCEQNFTARITRYDVLKASHISLSMHTTAIIIIVYAIFFWVCAYIVLRCKKRPPV